MQMKLTDTLHRRKSVFAVRSDTTAVDCKEDKPDEARVGQLPNVEGHDAPIR